MKADILVKKKKDQAVINAALWWFFWYGGRILYNPFWKAELSWGQTLDRLVSGGPALVNEHHPTITGHSDGWPLYIPTQVLVGHNDVGCFLWVNPEVLKNLPSTVQVRRPTVSWAWSTVNRPGVLLLTGSITFFLLLTVLHTVDRRLRYTERKSLISDNGVCLDSTAVLQVDLWTAEAKADRRAPRVTCQTLKTPGELVCSCYLFSVWLS